MKAQNLKSQRLVAALISAAVSFILFCLKYYAFQLTQSSSIYSDALEGIVNILAGVFLVITILYASRPADEGHPYGHGKIEFVSAIFEGALIGFAAIVIAFQAIQSWVNQTPLAQLDTGLYIVAAAGLVNLVVGLFLLRTGKKSFSEALQADGQHLISDFYTTAVIVIGLLVVQLTGIVWIDKGLALALSVFLLWTGYGLVTKSLGALLDSQSLPHLNTMVTAFNRKRNDAIIHIHHLRAIRSGGLIHVDAHVSMPEFWTLEDCHTQLELFEHGLKEEIKQETDFHFHMDPCMKGYCAACPIEPCPIRRKDFVSREKFELKTLLLKDEELEAYQL